MTPDFIIVDDDPINNMVCGKIIKQVFPSADVQTFTDPEAALIYIRSNYAKSNATDALLFLDINMPALSGWEFLDAFELFDETVKEHIKIYMLSSSVDRRDKESAYKNKNVLDYFQKPLSWESVESLLVSLSC
ncbi:MAG: response regulator [Panacibacter sp.]